jgi:hypothetical protein
MSSPTKAQVKAFLQAARDGDAAKLRELLAAGVPADSSDQAGQSALFHAVGLGHLAAAQVLLDAGADPHQRWGRDHDLLGSAAFLDSPDMVRLLLARGVDVNAADRQGFTALMAAAHEGNLEIVRVLVEAGADLNARGSFGLSNKRLTALEWARRERKKQVAEYLATAAGATGETEDPAHAAFESFGAGAALPAFQQTLDHLGRLSKKSPTAWKRCKGVYRAVLKPLKAVAQLSGTDAADPVTVLGSVFADFRKRGFLLVLAAPWDEDEDAKVALYPTAEKYAVLLACETDGANYGHSTHDIIVWLRELEKDHPFVLMGCGGDFVQGQFLRPVADAAAVATRLGGFCPALIDGDLVTSPDDVARDLRRDQGFFLWWD